MISDIKKVLVISPHPDDETLGAGGSIKRFIDNGIDVNILIVCGHMPPLYTEEVYQKTVTEAKEAFKILGVQKYKFLDIPATKVNEMPVASLNKLISDYVAEFSPDTVLIPFPDRHIDHKIVFDSAVVACRPNKKDSPKNVLMYETVSETHWNVYGAEHCFVPDLFINIDKQINYKKKAFDSYKSQNKVTISRSSDALDALAKFRGSQNGCNYAEAFKVARIII